MKKLALVMLAFILTAVLAGCNTRTMPAVTPYTSFSIYSPDPNNVNFNDKAMTTNFATDDPAVAMPYISANAGG